nr:MAG TPA: hypothetical protein [Caudoviricetes sp.]
MTQQKTLVKNMMSTRMILICMNPTKRTKRTNSPLFYFLFHFMQTLEILES